MLQNLGFNRDYFVVKYQSFWKNVAFRQPPPDELHSFIRSLDSIHILVIVVDNYKTRTQKKCYVSFKKMPRTWRNKFY